MALNLGTLDDSQGARFNYWCNTKVPSFRMPSTNVHVYLRIRIGGSVDQKNGQCHNTT